MNWWTNLMLRLAAKQPLENNEATKTMSSTTAIVFIVLGALGLVMAIITLILYAYFRKRKQAQVTESFKVKEKKARYNIYNFWINYVYFFLAAVGFIAAIVLLPIGITNLV